MLEKIFKKVVEEHFEDCNEAYVVSTNNCHATIGIEDDELCVCYLYSEAKGGATEMINLLEQYSVDISKHLVFSNVVNLILENMLIKRGYIKKLVPFSPKCNIMDLVSVYKK